MGHHNNMIKEYFCVKLYMKYDVFRNSMYSHFRNLVNFKMTRMFEVFRDELLTTVVNFVKHNDLEYQICGWTDF